METPESWVDEIETYLENDGNDLNQIIEQIQFDAWVQGMTDAANIGVQLAEIGELSKPVLRRDVAKEFVQSLHTGIDFSRRPGADDRTPLCYEPPNAES
jgi:hypothetical protein